MAGLVTSEFRVHNAKQFIEMFGEPEDSMYFFVGKYTPWLDEQNMVLDSAPPTPSDAKFSVREVWNEMIAMKKILPSDVSLGLHRYDWTHGAVYDQYDDRDGYIHHKKWYTLTSQNQVFACLNNGRRLSGGTYSGVPSTYEPFYDNANPTVTVFNTPDGYTWKYMYTVAPSEFLKFSTPSWISCVSTEDSSKKSTGIYSVLLSDFGTGYSVSDCVVRIIGDGTGATATPVIVGGQLVEVKITNAGSGYTRATVAIEGVNNTPATARAVVYGRNGIGGRPAVELGAYFVVTSMNLQYSEGGVIPVQNEYRQFGFIRNPETVAGEIATGGIYNMVYRMQVNSSSVFAPDDILSVNGGTARVIHYETSDPTTKYITVASATVAIKAGDVLSSGTKSLTVIGIEDAPDLVSGSGDCLYMENTQPVYRKGNQQETFILVSEM